MASLVYNPQISPEYWAGEVVINFEAVYDPIANCTTVNFYESSHEYFGRAGYGSWAETMITVKPADNPSGQQIAFMRTDGPTSGGMEKWKATPSPKSIVVQHALGPRDKSITIVGSTTIYCAATASATRQESFTREGSITIEPSGASLSGIVRIENTIGIPYVAKDGQWHRGMVFVGDGGNWKPGG